MTNQRIDEKDHSVPEEDAIASQYYVAKVTQVHSSHGANKGDTELILSDSHLNEGHTKTSKTYGSDAPPKKWSIIGGPFECPPMPHVLALEAWFDNERPEEPWELYNPPQNGTNNE